MKINSLENSKIQELTRVYNQGFSDYVIQFNADESYLTNRWAGARVQLNYSAGGWLNGELSGLLMTGIDDWQGQKTAFNAATCVAPNARGNDFTKRAYDFLIPQFKAINVTSLRLEVIQSNERAVRVYEKIGFKIERELLSFMGAVNIEQFIDNEQFIFKKETKFNPNDCAGFINFQPSWEHLTTGIKLKWEEHECYTLSNQKSLMAYAIIAKKDARLKQFYINPTEKVEDCGVFFMAKLSQKYPVLKVINVDGNNLEMLNFYLQIGLKESHHQFEMSRNI